jgi:hypothetical protein
MRMRMKNINIILLFLMSIITGMGAIIGVKFGEKLYEAGSEEYHRRNSGGNYQRGRSDKGESSKSEK